MRRLVLAFFAAVLTCSAAEPAQIPVELFSADGSTIKDPEAPVSLKLPAGWNLVSASRSGNHETTLMFLDQTTHRVLSLNYQFPIQDAYPADPEAFLAQGMNEKVVKRQGEAGLADYKVRSASVKQQTVNTHPALGFTADYTARGPLGPQPMVEYMLKTVTNTMKAHFFSDVPAGVETEEFLTRLDSLTQTLNIP